MKAWQFRLGFKQLCSALMLTCQVTVQHNNTLAVPMVKHVGNFSFLIVSSSA